MHDCYPGEKQFSVKMKDMSPGMMTWNGDGFKVVHAVVEKYCDELTTCVVDIDHGVGVIRKNKNAPMEIVYDDGYDFETLKAFPEEEINLIPVQDFLEIFS
jgi:hypothetical protein